VADIDTDRLQLRPGPDAARLARAWLRQRLLDWSSDGAQTAELLVSELVTNAVLHSEDAVEVTAELRGATVLVEVVDHNPSSPVLKAYARDAATGRGLHLVEAFSDEWGVHEHPDRKAVWFRISDDEGVDQRASGNGMKVDRMPDSHTDTGRPPRAAAASDDLEVCLAGLPVAVYLAAEEHHDALMREFNLLVAAAPGSISAERPDRLIVLAVALLASFGRDNEQRRMQVETARRAGRTTVDVIMTFPRGSGDQVLGVAGQLDEVDAIAVQGRLLTPPAPEAVRRFRHWYSTEVVRQLAGFAPMPWPFPLDPPTPRTSG
jgi:anti-sigma regulatory factor (Ser/Thr protein kinase)